MWKGTSLVCDLGNFSLLCHSVRLRMPGKEILITTTLTPLSSCGSSQLLPGTSLPPRSNCLLATRSVAFPCPLYLGAICSLSSHPPGPIHFKLPCLPLGVACHILRLLHALVAFAILEPSLRWISCLFLLVCYGYTVLCLLAA